MAKNKKKKKINEQYGNGIAPISLQNDKFTIKTPEPKKKTKKEQEEFTKKQNEAAKSLGNAVEYTAKKTGLGVVQGVTGFVDAPLQNVQEGTQKAQNKSTLDNYRQLAMKNMLPGNLGRISETILGLNKIANDPNKNAFQKTLSSGMEIINSLSPITNTLEDVGQFYAATQQLLGRSGEQDLKKTRKVVNKPSDELTKKVEKDREKLGKAGQIAGDTGQVVGNMIPSIAASIITGGAGGGAAAQQAASLFTMGVSAKGQATREAEQRGADLHTANNIGMIKGLTEVLTEKISGGVKLFGKGSVDDIVEAGLNKYIKNKGFNYLAKQGVGVLGENIEEWISDVVGVAIDKATVDPDAKYTFKDWANTGMMTVLSTLALNGITGGYSPSSYINNATELEKSQQTENTQKVIETELQNRLATEFNGKATAREISKLQAEVIEDIKNGYISTDTIEKTLGGETYTKLEEINKQKSDIQTQIDELQQKADNNELSSLEEKQKLNDLKEQIKTIDDSEIRKQLNQEIQETIKNDIGLQESYREVGRRTENYKVDLDSIQDEKQRAVYQKAMDSGVLNNSNKTHALVDMIAKISSEKGINFDFTNNEQLEKSGFGVNGRNINGYVTDSGITINLNSGKAINRIVGHELTHTFEGTTLYTELQDSLKDFLGNEWDNQLERYKELYKGVKNANIENELTSDLIGDYLFTDENYVKNLSTKNKNLFEKIYDEIKYLYNVATAGSKEKRQLEKVKRTFDRIYNETESKVTSEDAKLSIEEKTKSSKEELDNSSFSLDQNAKRYEDLTKTSYIEYFTKDNGDVRINLMDSNNNLVNQLDLYNQREAISELGEELGKQIYQTSSVDNQKINIGNDINNLGKENDYFMTHRPTETGITADDLTKQGYEVGLPNDIYEHPEYYSVDEITAKETMKQLNKVRNNPEAEVTIYRATTGDKINKGDWVTLSRSYAEQHNESQLDGKGNIVEKVVKAKDIQHAGDVLEEWGYFPADIRYSLSTDSQGRELSEGQQEYFKDEAPEALDKNGNIEVMYHTTPNKFTIFDKSKLGDNTAYDNTAFGFFVTPNKEFSNRFGDIDNQGNKSNVMELYAHITKPITHPYNADYMYSGEELDNIVRDYLNAIDETEGLNELESYVEDGDFDNLYEAYINTMVTDLGTPFEYAEEEKNILEKKGYDSVRFIEGDERGTISEDRGTEPVVSFAVFNSNQLKNIDNLNPTENDDIRYSLDIAPISKNLLTQAEQDELEGLRAVENSGFAELTPEEQSRMMELENRANKVLDKKAEKMLRSASYKAINTSTKIAENYLDFDARQKKEFRNQMREFSNMTRDELVNAETYNKVKDIVNQYANKEYTYFDDSIESVKKELKHTKIQISDELKNQITDYGDFVKDSRLLLRRNSGESVDKVYKEYSEMYPGFFDENVWNEADQLEALNDFANHDFSVTEKYRLSDNDLKAATDLIYNKLLDNSLTQQDLIETEEILDKKVQKRTRSVVIEELLGKMGVTPETIQVGKDISAIDFARTDPVRVNEKVFGWKTGQLINDATVNFAKHQEAEKTRFINSHLKEAKETGIKARSKFSEYVQKYGEKQYVDRDNVVHPYGDTELARDVPNVEDRQKIKNAARLLRQRYDEMLDQVNPILTEFGYDEIPKRQDYMMHFTELADKFSEFGLPFNKESMMAEDLPTDINGLTEFNRPGRTYFANAKPRTGLQTTYDAITGYEKYVRGISEWIYHTETIQRYRALSRLIRETYGREHGYDNVDLMTDEELAQRVKDVQGNKLTRYAAWLDKQANAIANKKAAIDRIPEEFLGRRVYTVLNTLKSQVGSNMTGFNVRSAMTNFASAIQGASKTQKLAFVKGTVETINNIIHNDGMIDKSDFLTRRFGTESLSMKPWQKLSQAGQIFMEGSDYFTANQIWRGKYNENLMKGMSEQDAIKNADDFAARIMGDRSKGSTAELFNSKTLGLLTQFQLEVNNQWSSLIHDNKMDIESGNKTPLQVTFQLGQLFAASYMFNTMMKSLTGSDVMIDPIDMLLKIFRPDDRDKDKSIVERAQEVLGDFINQLPFASMFTGGRIPIGEAFKGGTTLVKKLMGGTDNYGNKIDWADVDEDLKDSLAYWILPTGWGQVKKTTKGLSMYDDKLPIAGSYTKSGNLRFSAEDTPFGRVKAGLFGQYSSKYAQDYIDSGYKSINASKLDEMKDLDMNSTEYRNYREGLSAAGTSVEDKLDYINSLDVPYADKDIMASNVAKKDIDMKEYNKYGSYEEFNYAQKNPAKYQVMKYIGGYDTYKNYEKEINDIKADYDRNGKAIANSRKNKVIKYVNSLNLTKAQKAMLIKEQYPSFTKYDKEIASYINSQNIRYIEKASILKQLGFTAYDRQIINYIKQNYRTVEEQQEELEKLGFKVYNYNGKTYVR